MRFDLCTIVFEIKNGFYDVEVDFNVEVQKDTNYIFVKIGEVLVMRMVYCVF